MPYFDHNATAPLSPVARDTWLRLSTEAWHNPSSPTRDGARARLRLDATRERLAAFLGTATERVVFNSGATEGAHSVFSYWRHSFPADARIALNPTEHPCVLEAARRFFPERIVWIPLSSDGVVRIDALETMLTEDASLAGVAVMAANNETGVIQPWREIGRLCTKLHRAYLCDGTQWLGKLPASGLGAVGWLIASAHKFGGPKGTGFLALPPQSEAFSAQSGGAQEQGHRGGTEDLPSIAAAAAALIEAEQSKVFLEEERLRWRRAFEHEIVAALPSTRLVASDADRLWNTVSLILPQAENTRWVAKLDKRGFAVSTGSACAAGKEGPSHVLAALGIPPEEARRVIRISSGWDTTDADWQSLLAAILEVAVEIVPPDNVVKL